MNMKIKCKCNSVSSRSTTQCVLKQSLFRNTLNLQAWKMGRNNLKRHYLSISLAFLGSAMYLMSMFTPCVLCVVGIVLYWCELILGKGVCCDLERWWRNWHKKTICLCACLYLYTLYKIIHKSSRLNQRLNKIKTMFINRIDVKIYLSDPGFQVN